MLEAIDIHYLNVLEIMSKEKKIDKYRKIDKDGNHYLLTLNPKNKKLEWIKIKL